jgi:hypothetical protein
MSTVGDRFRHRSGDKVLKLRGNLKAIIGNFTASPAE